MQKKLSNRTAKSFKNKESSGTIVYLILFLLLILASISWIQNNTRPQNYAQDVTPLLRCESPCTYNSQCPTGLFCHNGTCRNPQCKDAVDCTCTVTPTYNPNAPTKTPRPTSLSVSATKTPTPIKSVTPTIVKESTPAPSVIVIISPQPTIDGTPTPSPTPVFEIDKETPQKRSILEVLLNFIADIFCRIFGC